MSNKLGWTIVLYKADDVATAVATIGNFPQFGNRHNDDVIVFNGMFGLDSYMVWYIHKNLGNYDFSTININLTLYAEQNLTMPFFNKQYKILDIKYNANESRYELYAMSLDSVKLKTKLVDYDITSLAYNENRGPKDLLIDVLEKGKEQIFKVIYFESPYEKELRSFQYRYFTYDENWSVEDFINYIADQNHFEWYVNNNVLYIGNECRAIRGQNATNTFDLETDNVGNTAWFRKYNGVGRPINVSSHISEIWRCVWVKHMAGRSGGISKACFTRIGIGTLDKENYLKTLEGELEIRQGLKLLKEKPYSHYIVLGNILKDTGSDQRFIDEITVQKNKPLFKVTEPSDVKFDRGNDAENPLRQTKVKVSRSTPYLDSNAGLFFPVSWLEDETEEHPEDIETYWKGTPPNMVLFQVHGREEATVQGPFVLGNSEDHFKNFKIPNKHPKDFRFSLPIGWTAYVDGIYGKTLLQCDGVPTFLGDANTFPYPGNAENNPNGQEKTYIYMRPKTTEAGSEYNEISLNAGLGNSGEEVGSKLRLRSDEGFYFETNTASTGNKSTIEGKKTLIRFISTDGSKTSTLLIKNDGNIELNCDPTALVKVTQGGVAVSLTNHTHDYSHTHQVPVGPAIPGPPATAVTQSTTDTIGESDNHSKYLRCVKG